MSLVTIYSNQKLRCHVLYQQKYAVSAKKLAELSKCLMMTQQKIAE